MTDLPMIAATEWARANSELERDPVKFGSKVAQAYCACHAAQNHSGDEKATTAALAALSIPLEVLQRLEQVSALMNRPERSSAGQTVAVGA